MKPLHHLVLLLLLVPAALQAQQVRPLKQAPRQFFLTDDHTLTLEPDGSALLSHPDYPQPLLRFRLQEVLQMQTGEVRYRSKRGAVKRKTTGGDDLTPLTFTHFQQIPAAGVLVFRTAPNSNLPYDCRLTFSVMDEGLVSVAGEVFPKQSSAQPRSTHLFFQQQAQPEAVFGGGCQSSHLNLVGHRVPMLVEEQGIGRGDKGVTGWLKLFGAAGDEFTNYCPIPYFLTSSLHAYQLQGYRYGMADFTRQDRLQFAQEGSAIKVLAWVGSSPLGLLERRAKIMGTMPLLPDWAHGTWLGLQGGTERVTAIVDSARASGNPVSALWIQDWCGRRKTRLGSQLWWKWEADTTRYPDFPAFCQQMNNRGIRVLGYINPFLAMEGRFYEEALAKGYLVRDSSGEAYELDTGGFPAVLVDLTNPAAYRWLKRVIHNNMLRAGLSGWMADYAEWLPFDCVVHDSTLAPDAAHNLYPVLWAKLNREVIAEAGKEGEVVFFTRSGYTGSERLSTLFWLGDQLVDWGPNDGLKSTLPGLLNSGMSGITLNHSDVGGYTTIHFPPLLKRHRSRELLYRWAEFNAFTPVLRTHEGILPERNLQVYSDPAAVRFFARMGQLHWAMKLYFQRQNDLAQSRGLPILRHTWLNYPAEANALQAEEQFMVGDGLLVLPVLEPDAATVRGWFPPGRWQHVLRNEVIEGPGWFTINAPLGTPAAFTLMGNDAAAALRRSVQKIPALQK